ncbi:hypothetical protein HKX48_003563 [Thoreauomyces humboldtii]|nr:hypothetical protein HKX48_003563 [Thoreauomyces humboldtii]
MVHVLYLVRVAPILPTTHFWDAAIEALPELIAATHRLATQARDFLKAPTDFGPEAADAAADAQQLADALPEEAADLTKGAGQKELSAAEGAATSVNNRLLCQFGMRGLNFGLGVAGGGSPALRVRDSIANPFQLPATTSSAVQNRTISNAAVSARHGHLAAPGRSDCLWDAQNTKELRLDSTNLRAVCTSNGDAGGLVWCIVNNAAGTGSIPSSPVPYTQCAASDALQCDHMLELQEHLDSLYSPTFAALSVADQEIRLANSSIGSQLFRAHIDIIFFKLLCTKWKEGK